MHHNYSLKNNRCLTDSRLTSLKIVEIKTKELPQPALSSVPIARGTYNLFVFWGKRGINHLCSTSPSFCSRYLRLPSAEATSEHQGCLVDTFAPKYKASLLLYRPMWIKIYQRAVCYTATSCAHTFSPMKYK